MIDFRPWVPRRSRAYVSLRLPHWERKLIKINVTLRKTHGLLEKDITFFLRVNSLTLTFELR